MAEKKCKFILKNSSPAYANALRKTLIQDIPKMAIDEVEFHLGSIDVDGKEYESITPLFDEIIAHRLGMIPVPTYDTFNFKEECVCGGEGCPNCTFMYSLNKNGPCTVYSGDLIPLGDESLQVKDKDIPIVELGEKQSVLIYAHAILGTARKHVKWQVALGVGYKYMPKITIGKVKSEDVKDIVANCPKKIFVEEKGKLVAKNPMDCVFCRACEDISKEITVDSDENELVFKFETDGSLTAEETLNKAVEILSKNAKEISEKVSTF